MFFCCLYFGFLSPPNKGPDSSQYTPPAPPPCPPSFTTLRAQRRRKLNLVSLKRFDLQTVHASAPTPNIFHFHRGSLCAQCEVRIETKNVNVIGIRGPNGKTSVIHPKKQKSQWFSAKTLAENAKTIKCQFSLFLCLIITLLNKLIGYFLGWKIWGLCKSLNLVGVCGPSEKHLNGSTDWRVNKIVDCVFKKTHWTKYYFWAAMPDFVADCWKYFKHFLPNHWTNIFFYCGFINWLLIVFNCIICFTLLD